MNFYYSPHERSGKYSSGGRRPDDRDERKPSLRARRERWARNLAFPSCRQGREWGNIGVQSGRGRSWEQNCWGHSGRSLDRLEPGDRPPSVKYSGGQLPVGLQGHSGATGGGKPCHHGSWVWRSWRVRVRGRLQCLDGQARLALLYDAPALQLART